VLDGKVEQSRLALSRVAPAVMACLARHAANDGDMTLEAGVLSLPGATDGALLIANSDPGYGDTPALGLAERLNGGFGRGLRIPFEQEAPPSSLGLPAQGPAEPSHWSTASHEPFACHSLANGQQVTLQPCSAGMAGGTLRISTLLIPGEVSAEEGGLRPVSVTEALRYLIAGCCGPGGKPLDTSGFSRLSTWLESADRYLVDAGNLDAVVKHLGLNEQNREPLRQGVS
jgi:tubulin polyglutamylase TTLL5